MQLILRGNLTVRYTIQELIGKLSTMCLCVCFFFMFLKTYLEHLLSEHVCVYSSKACLVVWRVQLWFVAIFVAV